MVLLMTPRTLVTSSFALLSALSACGDEGGPPDDPREPGCFEPTSGPTYHAGDVGLDEVWTADTGPHIVEQDVRVRNGATLTIEACADVQVAQDKTISVAFPGTPNTGTLIVAGTADRPVSIHGRAGARWGTLLVQAPGTAMLSHVTIANAGNGNFDEGATIRASGDGEDGADPIVFVDHVRIEDSLGVGAWFDRGASFAEGSKDLVVERAGQYALEVNEHALHSLPNGTYTGNGIDEILINTEGTKYGGVGLLEDTTLRDLGVPYRVGTSVGDTLAIGGRQDKRLVTLTIEAGVTMRFLEGGALKVQTFTNLEPSTGALRILGSAAQPVVLTAAQDVPQAGDWMGIWYGGVPAANNVIDHARIEYAGGDCRCVLATCSAIDQHEGAIILTGQPASAFVTNTEFSEIAGHAISQGYMGTLVDFTSTNSFDGVLGCEQTLPGANSCPAPRPECY